MLRRRVGLLLPLPLAVAVVLPLLLSIAPAQAFKPRPAAAAPVSVPGVPPTTTPRTCPSTARMASSASGSTTEGSGSGAAQPNKPVPISRIGFGTYRVGNSKEQAAAIREALLNGVTLIDTSANYGDGDSEKTIGVVVRALVEEGKLRREDLVLVSKVSQSVVQSVIGDVWCLCCSSPTYTQTHAPKYSSATSRARTTSATSPGRW